MRDSHKLVYGGLTLICCNPPLVSAYFIYVSCLKGRMFYSSPHVALSVLLNLSPNIWNEVVLSDVEASTYPRPSRAMPMESLVVEKSL